jgi:hypothetical protein
VRRPEVAMIRTVMPLDLDAFDVAVEPAATGRDPA